MPPSLDETALDEGRTMAVGIAKQDGPAMRAVGIERSLGYTRVLRGVSFEVAKGELVALIGPNGAGKSTLLRGLATILRPHAGTAFIHGRSLLRERDLVRAMIGYLAHGSGLYDGLTVRENLWLAGRLQGVADGPARIERAITLAQLQAYESTLVRHLSKGLTRRLALERALLHDPPLLLLDEPFDGLDPQSHERLAHRLRDRCAAGGAILLVTHDLHLAAALCDRTLLLADGRVRAYEPDLLAAAAPVLSEWAS